MYEGQRCLTFLIFFCNPFFANHKNNQENMYYGLFVSSWYFYPNSALNSIEYLATSLNIPFFIFKIPISIYHNKSFFYRIFLNSRIFLKSRIYMWERNYLVRFNIEDLAFAYSILLYVLYIHAHIKSNSSSFFLNGLSLFI